MSTTFEIKQSYNSEDVWIKLTSQLEEGSLVSEYAISYNVYDSDTNGDPIIYSYSITDSLDTLMLTSGIYIPVSSFTSTLTDTINYSLVDGVYNFNIDTTFNTASDPQVYETLPYNSVECFYQNILNTYTQEHLDYNWTVRYKEDSSELLQIAEEMTWIDALGKANNLGKVDEFLSILNHLTNYFTLNYDY